MRILTKYISPLLFFTSVIPALAQYIPSAQPDFDPAGQRELVVIDSSYTYNLSPHTATYASEGQILGSVYEGLFSYDPYSLEPLPALASSYFVSRDKLRWVFTIREGAMFSNGERITAKTFRDSWFGLINPSLKAPFAAMLDCVEGVQEYRTGRGRAADIGIVARDERTLVLTLKEPANHLPNILCHHAFAAVSLTKENYSGAYIPSYVRGKGLQLIKNEKYWDADNVSIPSILISNSDDLDENTYLFNTGKADWVMGGVRLDSVLDPYAVRISAEFATEYLFFRADKTPWNRSDFRNALIAAVPWDRLRAESLVPAQTFIYPIQGYPSGEGLYQYDQAEAELLLKKARESAGIPSDTVLELSYAIPDVPYMRRQADVLKQAWEKLGIKVSVVNTPAERYFQSIASGWEADLFTYTWIGDFADPVSFLEIFRGGSSLNSTGWKDADYDRLLAEAARSGSFSERMNLLSQAEQRLLNSGMVLPISHPVSLNVISSDYIGGWYGNGLDIHPFKYLYFKKRLIDSSNII